MAGQLSQVSTALEENRRELVLKGSDVSNKIKKHGLDPRIFKLKLMNFLEISDACLSELPKEIEELQQLKNLNVRGNLLQTIPDTIGELCILRTLDLSRNQLTVLPETIGDLSELYSLDVGSNQLLDLPETICQLEHLTVLNISCNKFQSLSKICRKELIHLSELEASKNEINTLDHKINHLAALKKCDLSYNKLTEIPVELSSCSKLKELFLKGNPLKDNRLAKMVKQDRGIKGIVDNIRTRGTRQAAGDANKEQGSKPKGKQRKKKSSAKESVNEPSPYVIQVLHFKESADQVEVKITEDVALVRPYIVCCIVEDIDLERDNQFKKFIKLQTQLHDGPLCGKRTRATIATHDLRAIKAPLVYDARPPALIEIVPLMKSKPVTAQQLVSNLTKEAEEQRKAQKRNTFSGVHKYLDLLVGHEKFPCFMNNDGHVISFPPITNADITKIGKDTHSLLIEVTSSQDLPACKDVLDELIKQMLLLELGRKTVNATGTDSSQSSDEDAVSPSLTSLSKDGVKKLMVRQVRILDEIGTMKVVYPSRSDLNYDDIQVMRD